MKDITLTLTQSEIYTLADILTFRLHTISELLKTPKNLGDIEKRNSEKELDAIMSISEKAKQHL